MNGVNRKLSNFVCRMPPKANRFNFDLTCLICSETFNNQMDVKNHGCRKFLIKYGCCLNTFSVRNEMASHLNQKGIYEREPMIPPSPADQSEPIAEANTLDSLEQVLQSVNIPSMHTITESVGDVLQLSVFAASVEAEENTVLSMPLIASDEESHNPEASKEQPSVRPQITESSETTQCTSAIKIQSRGKDIENLRQQYSPPESLNWTTEHSSAEATPSASWTSYFPKSSTSRQDISDTEPSSSSTSRNRSRSRSPRPPVMSQNVNQEPFHLDDITYHFEWQLLHGRVRMDTATSEEVDRFVFLDQSLRSQLEGTVDDPADRSHEDLLEYFHNYYQIIMSTARARRASHCPPGSER